MNHAIILAAGKGKRFSQNTDKMLVMVAGYPLIYYPIMAFNDHSLIDAVIIMASKKNIEEIKAIIKKYRFPKVKKIVIGGMTRQKSLEKGLNSLKNIAQKDDFILVHNGANALLTHSEIDQCLKVGTKKGACILGKFVSSTIKEVNKGEVLKTHDRNKLFSAETPQCATFSVLNQAIKNAQKKKLKVTDESMLLEAIEQKVVHLQADEHNFKVTTPGDLERVKMILGDTPLDFRVGIGMDSHFFEDGKKGLVLGGVKLPKEPSVSANSDGDLILHSIYNAISQAIGGGSIGLYADEKCKAGMKDSKKYIAHILEKTDKKGFKINNLGLMIEAKIPQIDPISPKIKKCLSKILNIPPHRIGITATTGEKSLYGQGLGIQCYSIVSLVKR